MELLLPHYVLIRPTSSETGKLHLFDISGVAECNNSPPILEPFWSSPPGTYFCNTLTGDVNTSHLRCTNRRAPSFQTLFPVDGHLHALAISVPVTQSQPSDIKRVHSVSIPVPLPKDRLYLDLHVYGNGSHFLVHVQKYSRLSYRPFFSRGCELIGLWSFTVDLMQGQGAEGVSPGNVRLDREHNTTSPIRFGNILQLLNATGEEDNMTEFRVDDVSGSFVQFPRFPAWRRSRGGISAGISLFTLRAQQG